MSDLIPVAAIAPLELVRLPDHLDGRTGSNRSKLGHAQIAAQTDIDVAAIMSLIQSAKLNGHDPFVYLKDILARLPTQPNSRIGELLPHRWLPDPSA